MVPHAYMEDVRYNRFSYKEATWFPYMQIFHMCTCVLNMQNFCLCASSIYVHIKKFHIYSRCTYIEVAHIEKLYIYGRYVHIWKLQIYRRYTYTEVTHIRKICRYKKRHIYSYMHNYRICAYLSYIHTSLIYVYLPYMHSFYICAYLLYMWKYDICIYFVYVHIFHICVASVYALPRSIPSTYPTSSRNCTILFLSLAWTVQCIISRLKASPYLFELCNCVVTEPIFPAYHLFRAQFMD